MKDFRRSPHHDLLCSALEVMANNRDVGTTLLNNLYQQRSLAAHLASSGHYSSEVSRSLEILEASLKELRVVIDRDGGATQA